MTKHVWAKLANDRKTYDVQLNLEVRELRGQSAFPDDYVVEAVRLDAACQQVVEDGEYHLEYIFNGRNETADVRVRAGMLLSKAT